MLLELCLAYTEAINTGSVPNIQNAWSYVCQNEHLRLINRCVEEFEKQISEVLINAKQECNYQILKKAFQSLREQAAFVFRHEALGGNDAEDLDTMQDLEIKLRNIISEKFKNIKQDYIRHCQAIAKQFLESELQIIRRDIQNCKYDSLDQVWDRLTSLKVNYVSSKAPVFPGY